jgi:excinuclease ABC subunit C
MRKVLSFIMFDIKAELDKLPNKPGVYIMKDEKGVVIYVGKAIILKNRVKQYFQNSAKKSSTKTSALVESIDSFDYIITKTEVDALVLESNLIKKFKPRYNILLKDDKSYPYVKITLRDEFPRVYVTRKYSKDGSKYFGPFTDARAVNETLEVIKSLFSVRVCNHLQRAKSRPCLNYHIKKCLGPCTGQISKEEYSLIIQSVVKFLNGEHEKVISELTQQMKKFAKKQEYERAAEIRDKLKSVEVILRKQNINLAEKIDLDVIAAYANKTLMAVEVFFVRGGILTGKEFFSFDFIEGATTYELMGSFIKQFYTKRDFIPQTILVESEMSDQRVIEEWLTSLRGSKVAIKIPKRGEKLELVKFAKRNARQSYLKAFERAKRSESEINKALQTLMEELNLDKMPSRIEAFDISNLGNDHIVGSMVVFQLGLPDKKKYRRFRIKTIQVQDDYASMREVLTRRIKYIIQDEKNKKYEKEAENMKMVPDLILVDGGKSHANMARDCLDSFQLSVPVVGMVKDNKHQTRGLFVQEKNGTIDFKDPRQNALKKFIVGVQDEAHRFAIEYNKKLRKKRVSESELDEIRGIGKKTKQILLKNFGSVENISTLDLADLVKIKGISRKTAENILTFFSK